MLLKKFDIVVFKENEGLYKKVRIRGWVCMLLFFLVVGLIGSNVYFWRYFAKYQYMQSRLSGSEKTVQDQKVQLFSLANKITSLEDDLTRLREFDSKLRVMVNLDKGQLQTVTPLGGTEAENFADSYLPLYRQELLARKMHNFLEQLATETRLEEVRQQELLQSIRANRELLESTPSIWPCEGFITSEFGPRISPFTGRQEFHTGIDIAGPVGTAIYAPAQGKVAAVEKRNGYGLTVILDHGSGLTTCYAHLDKAAVKVGDRVTRGELVAFLGNSGRTTGPHLHYEIRLSRVAVNPINYILN